MNPALAVAIALLLLLSVSGIDAKDKSDANEAVNYAPQVDPGPATKLDLNDYTQYGWSTPGGSIISGTIAFSLNNSARVLCRSNEDVYLYPDTPFTRWMVAREAVDRNHHHPGFDLVPARNPKIASVVPSILNAFQRDDRNTVVRNVPCRDDGSFVFRNVPAGSYFVINVGVKIMVLYIILGLLGPLLANVLISSAATLALVASSDLTGNLYPAALGTATYGALSVVIGAALVTMIPGFASSFLTGQSVASGTAALQQTMSSVAGSTQMMAQLASASQSSKMASSDRSAESKVGAASGAPGASNGQTMAPSSPANADSMAPTGASQNGGATNDLMQMQSRPASAAPLSGSGSSYDGALVGQQGQNLSPGSGGGCNGGLGLQDYTPEQLRAFTPGQTASAMPNTDINKVRPEQLNAINESGNGKIAQEFLQKRSGEESRNAALSEGYGLGGLAQAAPRDQGQPTAVQVRISNPDKL